MALVLADPALYAFIGGEPSGPAALRDRYAALVVGHSSDGSAAWHNWIVRLRADGRAIGTVQATIAATAAASGDAAEVAWVIGLPWQGQGYAWEAARALVAWLDRRGVSIVEAHVHPEHGASAAVAARAGLQPTAELVDGERVWRLDLSGEPRSDRSGSVTPR